eukprot:TRINITY_DN1588_c6_g1_i1.p1 TRINITY_DN1588_c6_g1~~TRINITY_DN1588_c6_g1_i1.p1  ORF type:complete len:136 (+),score=39.39 TRINITY_DN1588_c6_g1_i1:64-471(+)
MMRFDDLVMKWAKNAKVSNEEKMQIMKFSCEGVENLEYVLNKNVPDHTKKGISEYLEELQSPSNAKKEKTFGAAYVRSEEDQAANGEEAPEGEEGDASEPKAEEEAPAEAENATDDKPAAEPAAVDEEVDEEELM